MDSGANVWTCDVLSDALAETARLSQHDALPIQVPDVDVTDRAAVQEFVREAVHASGRADVLVNNAGGVLGQTGRPVEDVSQQNWRAIFQLNVDGAFYCAQAVVPQMKQQRLLQSVALKRLGAPDDIAHGAVLRAWLRGLGDRAGAQRGRWQMTRW